MHPRTHEGFEQMEDLFTGVVLVLIFGAGPILTTLAAYHRKVWFAVGGCATNGLLTFIVFASNISIVFNPVTVIPIALNLLISLVVLLALLVAIGRD